MNIFRSLILSLGLFLTFLNTAHAQTSGFTVPSAHPRLWWNAERLARAKTWYSAKPFTPRADDPIANAMRYVLTGEAPYARKAIDYLMALQLPDGQVKPDAIGCDNCRFYGEEACVIYDWCFDQMSGAERSTIIGRWNKWQGDVNKQDWGGLEMPGSNYFWGNLRNSLEWGIATYGENPEAQSFLDHALNKRWFGSFIPYANSGARGGAPGEGFQYGSTMVWYPIISFISADFMGRSLYEESNFFRQAVFNNIYATTPAPIVKGNQNYYGFFPYNEVDVDDLLHERIYFGDFMQTMANYWGDKPVGQYARTWINLTKANTSKYVDAVNKDVTAKSYNDLPTDYYAAGLGILYSRSKWDVNATAFQAQMKYAGEEVGHQHADQGNFQLFRKGRWLTKESSGYADPLKGVNGKNVDSSAPEAHNTIFVGIDGKMKSLVGSWQTAGPKVERLENNANYVYAAVNMTDSYQSAEKPEVFENPYVDKIVREFLFIKPLESLIVFDRIQSKSKATPAANVKKMVLVHFEANPTIEDATHVSVTLGNQVSRLTTLVPSAPTYNVVDEGGTTGQFRLQITTSGQEQSYFINVLNGADSGSPKVEASVSETQDGFEVTLSHPTLGKAIVKLKKGALSQGGSVAYAASGTPSAFTDLATSAANILVSDNGPVWVPGNVVTGLGEEEITINGVNLNVYPNPVQTTLNITANFSEERTPASSARVTVYNSLGKMVESFGNVRISSTGEISLTWDTKDVPAGIYSVVMNYNNRSVHKKVLVKK